MVPYGYTKAKCSSCDTVTEHEITGAMFDLRCSDCGLTIDMDGDIARKLYDKISDEYSIARERVLRMKDMLDRLEKLATRPVAVTNGLAPVVWKRLENNVSMPCFKCGVPTKMSRNGVAMCENMECAPVRKARPQRDSNKWTKDDLQSFMAEYGFIEDNETEVIKSGAKLFKGGVR